MLPAASAFVPHDVLARPKRSAGAVIVRRAKGCWEVALVHHAADPQHDWRFPKGRIRGRESSAAAAAREVAEETGYRVLSHRLLGTLVGQTRRGRSKLTAYWQVRLLGGRFRPSREVDAVRWLPFAEAAVTIARRDEAEVLAVARGLLEKELEAAG
ncbi:MAG TPA: NUDIX domain-containing protein [Candidatus Dormibacteraeota bacterium]